MKSIIRYSLTILVGISLLSSCVEHSAPQIDQVWINMTAFPVQEVQCTAAGGGSVGDAPLKPRRGQGGVDKEAVASAVYHVLKHRHTVSVAVVVKELVLYLYMLAEHIEAQRLHLQNVVFERFWGGGGVDTVGEVALVEQPVEEVGLAVEADDAPSVSLFDRDGPKGEVGLHLVPPVA